MLSPSTLLSVQAALQGVGPALHGLPRPKPLRFRFSGTPQKHRLGWACVLCLPRSEQLRQPRSLTTALSWGAGRLLPSMVPTSVSASTGRVRLCLFWELGSSCDPPSGISRKSLVKSWKPVRSLVGDAVSGAEFAPFPCPLPPAFGGGWAGPLPGSSSGICSVLHSGNWRVVPKFRAFPKLILSRYPTV